MARFNPTLSSTRYEGDVYGKDDTYIGKIKYRFVDSCYAFYPNYAAQTFGVCVETLDEICDALELLNR